MLSIPQTVGVRLPVAFCAVVAVVAQLRAAEPAWWTQQRRDYCLPGSLTYESWKAQGFPSYCGGSQYQPSVINPGVALQNRVRAVVNTHTDLINSAALNTIMDGVLDGAALGSVVAAIHYQLWKITTETEAETDRHRWEMDQFKPYLAALEQAARGLNVSRRDSVPQSLITARESTEREISRVADEIPKIHAETTQEEKRAARADQLWLDKRNLVLKWMEVYFPVAPGLPHVADEHSEYSYALHIPLGPFQDRALAEEPEVLPVKQTTYAPAWYPELLSRPPEPLPAYRPAQGVEQQVGEIETLANRAAAAKAALGATRREMAAFRKRYLSYQKDIAEAEGNIYVAQCNLINAEYRLREARRNRNHARIGQLNATWLSLFATTKAVVWDAFKRQVKTEVERVTLATYGDVPLYQISDEYVERVWPGGQLHLFSLPTKYKRAREYGELVQQTLNIEKDAELLSLNAAQTLAMGANQDSRKIIDDTWATSGRDGRDLMHDALEMVHVPQPAIQRWYDLLHQAENNR